MVDALLQENGRMEVEQEQVTEDINQTMSSPVPSPVKHLISRYNNLTEAQKQQIEEITKQNESLTAAAAAATSGVSPPPLSC